MHLREWHPEQAETVLFLHGGNVAGWMWDEQAAALTGHHSLVPDLPGFGASSGQPWADLASVADELAELIRERAHHGGVHLVGLSLGAVLGVVLAARHPGLLRSVLLTGAALRGVDAVTGWAGMAQLRLWGSRGYWTSLARAYRLPPDSVEVFVRTGLGIDAPSARRMMREVYAGLAPATLDGLRDVQAPTLVLAGEKEPRLVRRSMPEVASRVPGARAALVPRMHHVWSAEDPQLFHRVLSTWLRDQEPSSELIPWTGAGSTARRASPRAPGGAAPSR